jgi:aryl-alcohol dehydrogenase-like predicted oxidoreductase
MEAIEISGTGMVGSRIGLGTWAIGGWMWGGTDEVDSIGTIHAALDQGVTLIDTAPVYGFGRSEEIVGKAIAARGERERVLLASNGETARCIATPRRSEFAWKSKTRSDG